MAYDVRIERLPMSAVIDLKGPADIVKPWASYLALPLPEAANTASAAEDLEVYWVGPEHWLLRAPLEREDRLLTDVRPGAAPEGLSVVLVSDTLAFFAIAGRDAQQVMAIASPLDCHERAFLPNGVSYTEAFGLKALVLRHGPGFEIAVERSYADFLEDYLQRATSI